MKQKIDFLKSAELFKHLTHAQLESIAKNAKVENYAKDQIIFLKGESAKYIFMIINGWVKGSRTSFNGEETILGIHSTHTTFGDIATLSHTKYIATAQAVTPSKVLKIPYENFIKVLQRDEKSLEIMFRINAERHNLLVNELEQLITCSAYERIGLFLLNLLNNDLVTTFEDENIATIKLPYAKSLVAAQLGMKAETFSRAFSKLKEDGFISPNRRTIKVNNIDKFKRYCRI